MSQIEKDKTRLLMNNSTTKEIKERDLLHEMAYTKIRRFNGQRS